MTTSKAKRAVGVIVALVLIVGVIFVIEDPFSRSAIIQPPEDDLDLGSIPLGTAIGERLPSFDLETLDGGQLSLRDLRGKVVLVNFWATWCPFCVDEIPDLEKVFREGNGDVVVLGINRAEPSQKQLEFYDDLGLRPTYPLLLDPKDEVALEYGIRAMPTTFFLDRNGVIAQLKLGQATIDEMRDGIEIASTVAEPAQSVSNGFETEAPAEPAPVFTGGDIDTFDVAQVKAAPEGAPIGVRGEKLMITNGLRHLVPLNKILSGGPPPDGIPSIDDPKFTSAEEASTWLSDDDFVLGIEYNGIIRAYPHRILVFHEIVNDEFGGKPLLITYCPLCFTGIAFEPFIDGVPVEFGTSGKLFNSDLVMYDRQTRSYWSQITGQAIRGELAGLTLKKIPIDTIRWGDWRDLHPDTQVLSRETGFSRSYDSDPYGSYYIQGGTFFPVEGDDDRLPTKAIVYGVNLGGVAKTYPEDEVAKAGGLINDVVGGHNLLILQEQGQIERPNVVTGSTGFSNRAIRIFDRVVDGVILEFELINGKLTDKQTGSEWSPEGEATSGPLAGKSLARIPSSPEFWFARSAFYPDTEIYFAA